MASASSRPSVVCAVRPPERGDPAISSEGLLSGPFGEAGCFSDAQHLWRCQRCAGRGPGLFTPSRYWLPCSVSSSPRSRTEPSGGSRDQECFEAPPSMRSSPAAPAVEACGCLRASASRALSSRASRRRSSGAGVLWTFAPKNRSHGCLDRLCRVQFVDPPPRRGAAAILAAPVVDLGVEPPMLAP